jgi:hypothetical protein
LRSQHHVSPAPPFLQEADAPRQLKIAAPLGIPRQSTELGRWPFKQRSSKGHKSQAAAVKPPRRPALANPQGEQGMDQIHDQALAGTCAKGTLWGTLRIGGLIAGAVLASLLMVELPLPLGGASEPPPYVPASDTWIELGAPARVETPVEAADTDAVAEQKQAGNKTRVFR